MKEARLMKEEVYLVGDCKVKVKVLEVKGEEEVHVEASSNCVDEAYKVVEELEERYKGRVYLTFTNVNVQTL